MSFITDEDRDILRSAAIRIQRAFGGSLGPETTFRFTDENVTRYVDLLDWEGVRLRSGSTWRPTPRLRGTWR